MTLSELTTDATRDLLLIVPASNNALPDLAAALDGMDESEMKRRKVEAVAYARHHFTPRVQLGVVEGLIEQWGSGARGYIVSLPLVSADGSSLRRSASIARLPVAL